MVLPMAKCWFALSVGWSQSLAMKFLRIAHKPLKKLVYFLSEFHTLKTWLVEVAHVVNGMKLYIMP